MYEVIPSPGTQNRDWQEIEKKIELIKPFAKTVHIDVVDGKFAPNSTPADPLPFVKYTLPSLGQALFFEVHLMVDNPIQYLKPFANAGFKRFIGQIEKMSDQEEFIAQGQLLGEVGLAIDGPTDVSGIKVPFGDLDLLLIMTIKAGESGQAFIPEYLKKAEAVRSANKFIKIEVDGGINDQTISLAKNAGANSFVVTSFLFKEGSPYQNYQTLLKKIG